MQDDHKKMVCTARYIPFFLVYLAYTRGLPLVSDFLYYGIID